jgi:hypothetical protein
MIYTILTYIKLVFSKTERDAHRQTRKTLEKLRNIPIKTTEEQKQFLDAKYPKDAFFVWSFKNVFMFIIKTLPIILLFMVSRRLWNAYITFEFALWQVIIIMVFLPIIINKIMKRFNLHNDDILVFFK